MRRAHASTSARCSQFSAQDSVLCWYRRKLYPAKILKVKDSASDCSPTQRYFVHYIGWAKSYVRGDNWRKASQVLVDNAHNRSICLVEEKLVTPQSSLPPRFRIRYWKPYSKTRDKHINTGVSFHNNDSVGSTLEPHLNRRLKRTVKNMCGAQSLGVMSPETATHVAVPHPPSPFVPEPASSCLDVNLNQQKRIDGALRRWRRSGMASGSPWSPIHPLRHLFAPSFDSELVNETTN
ncbi:hypothetical protein B0H14DRAFT_2985639 [Mycena olivaceomarginata]|nr:hypothetical protein B0H14DRAFT_2985639 [Mycena olivaceomarginata]